MIKNLTNIEELSSPSVDIFLILKYNENNLTSYQKAYLNIILNKLNLHIFMKSLLKPHFQRQVVQQNLPIGYWIQAFKVFDEETDLVAYGLDSQSQISLYKNPTWARARLSIQNGPVGMQHADIDGDGDNDIVICYQYGETMQNVDEKGGKIHWLENPGSVQKEWKKHYIGRSTAMHRMQIGHFTQTQKWQIIGLPIVERAHDIHSIVSIKLFRQPEDVYNAEKWDQQLIDNCHFRVIHEVCKNKYNKIFNIKPESNLDSILVASEEGITWLYYDQTKKKWQIMRIGEGQKSQPAFKGSGGVSSGTIGNDQCAYIAAIQPFHGNTISVYYKVKKSQNSINTGWQWQWKRVVLDTFDNPNKQNEGPCHYVTCVDLDGDGDDEFLVTLRGPQPWQGVYYYKAIDIQKQAWVKWKVSNDSAARIAVADFDDDGRLDFATIGYSVKGYYQTKNPSIVVYYNDFAPKKVSSSTINYSQGSQNAVYQSPLEEKMNLTNYSGKPKVHNVCFSPQISAQWITNHQTYFVKQKSIVINLGMQNVLIQSEGNKILGPRTSIILQNTTLCNVNQVLIFVLKEDINIGKSVLSSGWNLLGDISDFPKNVPLWKSIQYDLGNIKMDPISATGQGLYEKQNQRQYRLKVNLWYCPSQTNCGLHNVHSKPHDIFEVHTQIYGVGRMQKFQNQNWQGAQLFQSNRDKLTYEEILSQGNTHVPFASFDESSEFVYPWHQYYSDTECIWIAHEYHVI